MRRVLGVFFFAFLLAVTWPGYIPANRLEPSVLGLPLVFAWPGLWVLASFFVLLLLDRSESRTEEDD